MQSIVSFLIADTLYCNIVHYRPLRQLIGERPAVVVKNRKN